MSIRAKVIGCFLVILLVVVGVSAYSYWRSQRSDSRLALVNELFLPLSRLIVQLQGNVQGLAEDARRFYFQDDANSQNSTFSRMVRDLYPYLIRKKFVAVERLLAKHDKNHRGGMVTELGNMVSQANAIFEKLVLAGDRPQFDSTYLDLRAVLQALSRRVEDECQKITLTAQTEARENLISNFGMAAFIIFCGILTIVLSHHALMPLPQLIASIRKIADGDFHQSLKVQASDKDEIALLAREFNRMLVTLRERDKQIQLQQKELLQSERLAAVGQLSAEVVHEIRNPLNAISLNIDWLENELSSDNAEIGRSLKSISREIERLHQITESYLIRARLPMPETEKTEVNELIEEILEFSREEDRTRGIQVETELAAQRIFVRTHRSRLKQAFLNVLRNAKEAMPRGGKLTVRTEVRENISRILFSDSGHGMNESTRRMTFHPFFTTKPSGTGLGLMLTKNIVEEAQGTVHCESHLGEGTTFTFQFPI
jgi:signal transduction histidine kinase